MIDAAEHVLDAAARLERAGQRRDHTDAQRGWLFRTRCRGPPATTRARQRRQRGGHDGNGEPAARRFNPHRLFSTLAGQRALPAGRHFSAAPRHQGRMCGVVPPGKVLIHLSLCDAANPYQQLLKSDAVSASTRAGFALETSFSHVGVVRQIQLLRTAVARPSGARPRAIIVLPVRDGTLDDVAREALRNDVAWVVLNRRAATLASLTSEVTRASMFAV